MLFRSLTPAALVAMLVASPALAETTGSFKDVPAGHWAASAVNQVAVERSFMHGYPDGTFRGDMPFTRMQLALAVQELIRLLESQTHIDWKVEGLGGYEFQDLPADPEVRQAVLNLANHYRLFEGVPGVTSRTFEGEKQVTRYEMAKVIHRLLRLGEERGVVDPSVQSPQIYSFSDLPPSAWSYQAVKEVSERYQVMIGFPNGTFRGPEELTRYQFAASAAQTFPLVRALVEKSTHKDQPEAAKDAGARFMEATPFQLGVSALTGFPGVAGASGRWVPYFGPIFGLVDAQIATPLASGERAYGASANVGYAFPLGAKTSLQPFLGARVISTGAYTLGGLNYGAIAYHRPSPTWGLFLKADGTSPLGATTGTALGTFLGGAGVGVEYFFTPGLGLMVEGGYALMPAGTPAAGAGLTTAGSPTAGLGLTFRL